MLTLDDVDRSALLSSHTNEASRHPSHSRWMRARALGVPYRSSNAPSALGRSALAARRDRVAPLLARANDVLGTAIEGLNQRGFTVALADQDGVILRCWGGSVLDDHRVRSGFAEGTCWHESARGTNAIGTALAERTAVAVLGRAHYTYETQDLACYAALIRDPLSCSVGVLDITGPFPAADPLLGVLVESLAMSVESTLFAEVEERSRRESTHRVHGLRQALSLRDDVLAMVAHDLRSPLSTISLSASVLEQRLSTHTRASAPESRSVQAIAHSSQRMARMLEDLLEVARIERGSLSIVQQRCSAASLLDAALEIARATASGLQVTAERSETAPDVLSDRDRTLQVFANLIGNAAKFTPEGGRLILGCERRGECARFWVRDSGPGIRREHLAKLFERGWQARPTDRRGAGFGLYICKTLVEAQHGEIWAQSDLGRGATFYFTLPAA